MALAPTQLDYVSALRADARTLADAARRGPLDAPIGACPGWDLARLVAHVGSVHRWATVVATTRARPDRSTLEPPPSDPTALADWLDEGVDRLATALDALGDDEEVWNFSTSPNTGRFWPRRQAQETAMHRWDGQRAIGAPDPIPAALAADGIDELVDVWAPMILHGRDGIDIGGSVRLHATDPDQPADWTLRTDDGLFSLGRGGATGDVTVEGTASDLLLVLWRRLPVDAETLHVTGDRTVLERWLRLGAP